MKRFRFPLLAASALLVLMACSSTDESVKDDLKNAEPQPVNFDAYVNKGVTRAGFTGDLGGSSSYNLTTAGVGFGIFAYYTDNLEYSSTTIPNFMYNQKVTWSSSKWNYSPIKYWPNEYGNTASSDDIDKVSFFAYAPYVDVTASTGQVTGDKTYGITQLSRNTAIGDPLVKYITRASGSATTDYGVDLLWAVNNSNGLPYLNQTRTAGTTSDDKIQFTFNHALAKIGAMIQADGDDFVDYDGSAANKTKIYVRSVTITGFATKGALNLNNIEANKPLWYGYDGGDLTFDGITINDGRKDGREGTADGTQSNEKNAYLDPNIIQTNTATTGVKKVTSNSLFVSDLYVIPSGGSEKVDLTIVYDVETEDANLSTYLSDGVTHGSSIENRITKTNVLSGLSTTGIEAGKVYNLMITLGMKDIKLSAVISSGWTSASGAGNIVVPTP